MLKELLQPPGQVFGWLLCANCGHKKVSIELFKQVFAPIISKTGPMDRLCTQIRYREISTSNDWPSLGGFFIASEKYIIDPN